MFGINKNGTKHKVGVIMPAFFPASRTTYDNTQSGLSATRVQGAIDAVEGQIANSSDAYSASKAYAVGDYCIYNDTLYRCVTACTAAPWAVNSGCFVADTVVNAMNATKPWKLFTESLGTSVITLPTSYSELLFEIITESNSVRYALPPIPIGEIATDKTFRNGAVVTYPSTVLLMYQVNLNATTLNAFYVWQGGSDITSNCSIRILYR